MRLDPGAGASECGSLWLVHHSPGRLRVRARCFLGETELAAHVCNELEATQGVLGASHVPLTGSLLIRYIPEAADVESLLAVVTDTAGLRAIVDATAARRTRIPLADEVMRGARWLDDLSRELTGAGLYELIPAVLTATSLVSLILNPSQKGWLPRWDSALYWAYSVFHDGVEAQARGGAVGADETPPFRRGAQA